MTMRGSLWIGKKSTPWSKADTEACLAAAAVGLLAGLVVTYARTPLHLPGHKVLFWMIPALACRLVTRIRAGATISVLGTIAATLLLGGNLAGSALMLPLVVLAGVTLDVTVRAIEHLGLSARSMLPLLALAGIAGNLICFVSHLSLPLGKMFSSGNERELLLAALSHAIFGLLAGVGGALIGLGIIRFQNRG